jgi:hypothetical protein
LDIYNVAFCSFPTVDTHRYLFLSTSLFIAFALTALRTTVGGGSAAANGKKKPFFPGSMDCRNLPMAMQGLDDFNKRSNAHRVALITGQLAAGALVHKDATKLQFFGLPTPVGGSASGKYVGTASCGFVVRPIVTDADLGGCFFTLFKEADVGPTFPFPHGPAFTKTDVGDCIPGIANRAKSCIVCLPISCPVIFGVETLVLGTINEEHVGMLQSLTPDSAPSVWYEGVKAFDTTQHAALTDSANASKLAAYLPSHLADSPVDSSASPFVAITPLLTDDEVEAYEADIAQIETRLTKLANLSHVHVPSPAQAPPPVISVNRSGALDAEDALSVQSQIDAKALASTAARNRVKLQLILASLSKSADGTEVLDVGPTNPSLSHAYGAKAAQRNEIYGNVWSTVHKNLQRSMNKIVACANLGCRDRMLLMFLSTSEWLDLSMGDFDTLDEVASAKKGAFVSMLLPDSNAMQITRRRLAGVPDSQRNALLLGDAPKTVGKTDQTLNVMTVVEDMTSILGLGGNIIAFCRTGRQYDVEKEKGGDTPLLHTLTWQLMVLLFSHEYRQWHKKSSSDDETKLAYWILALLADVLDAITQVTHDEDVIKAGVEGLWSSIDVTPYWVHARQLAHKGRLDLLGILKGAAIPMSTYYKTSPQLLAIQQRGRKVEQQLLLEQMSLASPTKKPRLESGDAPPPGATQPPPAGSRVVTPDRQGDVIYTGQGPMPEPTYPAGMSVVCAGNLRHGVKCRNTAGCKKLHGGVAKMSAGQKKLWNNHVEATADMRWNAERVTSAMLL